MPGKHYSLEVRIQAISLLNAKVKIAQIEFLSNLPRAVIYFWNRKAKSRGFDSTKDPRILVKYLEDDPKSSKPGLVESIKQAVVEAIQKDQNGREKSCKIVIFKSNISIISTWRILRQAGFRLVKPTTKSGLTKEIRKKRLDFCLAH